MDYFKLASQQKVRFQTNKGLLTTEQLWDLDLNDLDQLAVSLDSEHKESGRKSFLGRSTGKDKIAKLKFDIVLDVLNTKVDDAQRAAEALEIKKHNEKIIGLIADKDEETLRGKSRKQLEAMLR